MPRLDPQLKEILVCPHCHGELEELERPILRCLNCGLGFSIADGFPNMLIDEAEQPEGFSLDVTVDDARQHDTVSTSNASSDAQDAA